ncbi:MAG: hypothetical protein ACOX5T_04980 [Candidatus Cryptobacteroides sp.]|jgi:hypothetical protein
MKKVILILSAVIFMTLLSGCGVGSYSVASGREDVAKLSFTATEKYAVEVVVDEQAFLVETVRQKAYKPGMRIKQTALNSLKLTPGSHHVVVKRGDSVLFEKNLFLSTGESKVIPL